MSHSRSTNLAIQTRPFELRCPAGPLSGRDQVFCGKRTPKGFRQQSSLDMGMVCESLHGLLTLSFAARNGNQSANPISAVCTCRNAVCLSYNANRTQELGGAWIGMRVAFELSHGCDSQRLQSTAPEHAGCLKSSSPVSFTDQLPSVTRTGFTCSHNHLCRGFASRQDFRKASIS